MDRNIENPDSDFENQLVSAKFLDKLSSRAHEGGVKKLKEGGNMVFPDNSGDKGQDLNS
jgi:hypothetical protein